MEEVKGFLTDLKKNFPITFVIQLIGLYTELHTKKNKNKSCKDVLRLNTLSSFPQMGVGRLEILFGSLELNLEVNRVWYRQDKSVAASLLARMK